MCHGFLKRQAFEDFLPGLVFFWSCFCPDSFQKMFAFDMAMMAARMIRTPFKAIFFARAEPSLDAG